jgi:hypothetical protein
MWRRAPLKSRWLARRSGRRRGSTEWGAAGKRPPRIAHHLDGVRVHEFREQSMGVAKVPMSACGCAASSAATCWMSPRGASGSSLHVDDDLCGRPGVRARDLGDAIGAEACVRAVSTARAEAVRGAVDALIVGGDEPRPPGGAGALIHPLQHRRRRSRAALRQARGA